MKTKTPTNMKELLNIGGRKLWRGMAYELTAFRNVEHFIELVGNLPLSEVTTTTIDDFVDELRDTVSNATVNRKLANVRTLLEFGADRGWLVMPSFKKKRLTECQGRFRWITDAEETKMLEFLNCEPEVKRFVTVLIDTGLRRGELLQLQAKDVDGLWIRLWTTKSKVARSVPLTERAQAELAKGLPFALDVQQLRKVWDALRTHMGLQDDPYFVLHALRHTTATRTLQRTGNLKIVQALLGHSKIATTLRYAHISDDDLLAAVR